MELEQQSVNMSPTTTTTTVTMSAMQRTFSTTELLEATLLELDMRTLLLSQRVSKHFQSTVQGSKVLRQALFLEPMVAASSTQIGPLLGPPVTFDERLSRPVSEMFGTFDSEPASSAQGTKATNTGMQRTTLNPLLLGRTSYSCDTDVFDSYVDVSDGLVVEQLFFTHGDISMPRKASPAFASTASSLADMLLVQPMQEVPIGIKHGLFNYSFTAAPGQTIGQVVEEVMRRIDASWRADFPS